MTPPPDERIHSQDRSQIPYTTTIIIIISRSHPRWDDTSGDAVDTNGRFIDSHTQTCYKPVAKYSQTPSRWCTVEDVSPELIFRLLIHREWERERTCERAHTHTQTRWKQYQIPLSRPVITIISAPFPSFPRLRQLDRRVPIDKTHEHSQHTTFKLVGNIETAEQRTVIQQYGDWYTGCWWVGGYIWYSEKGTGRAAPPPRPLLAVPNVTAHPLKASVPTSCYSIWLYNCVCSLKG